MDYMKYKRGFSRILVVFVILTVVSSYKCPVECKCKYRGATCAFERLDYGLFNFSVLVPLNIHKLNITCGKFSESTSRLSPRIFKDLNQLTILSIYNCKFEYIDENVFSGLNALKQLTIQDVPNLPIHPKTFHHVPNLEILKICDSDWHGLLPNSLCMLSKIHTLYFPKNQISSISEVFKLCTRNQSFFNMVTNLNLEFNQIEILESDFKQRFKNLKILSLKGNKIREIQNGALANFSQLRSFDISENNLTQLPDDFLSGCSLVEHLIISNNPVTKLPSSIGELKNLEIFEARNTLLTDINLLDGMSLREVDIHNSSLTTISTRLCRKNSNLEWLDLGQNNISSVPQNIFKNCKNLQRLFLSSNNISILFNESFTGLESLELLNLGQNNISSVPQNIFKNCKKLQALILSSNNISILFNESFTGLESLELLNLGQNNISSVPQNIFKNCKKLQALILSSNNISILFNEFFTGLERLELLDLRQNNISSVPQNIFKYLRKLRMLILSSNDISILFYESFTGLESLEWLDLANNHISRYGEETFRTMTNLKELNLSSNSLVEIPPIPSNIIKLDVSYNKITNINPDLRQIYSLTYFYAQNNSISTFDRYTLPVRAAVIDLANNQIETLDLKKFANLANLKYIDLRMNRIVTFTEPLFPSDAIHTSSFYISGNQFQCDCKLAWLKYDKVKWLASSKFPNFIDLELVTCFKHGKDWLPEGLFRNINANAFLCRYFQTCPETCLCTHKHNHTVNNVHCKNGNLTDGTGISYRAKWIDLSGNDLGSLSNKTFINQTKAEVLYLNNSKITTIAGGTFTAFNFLVELHLEYNDIRMLYTDSLFGLSNLKRLILKHNRIERIFPGTFNVTPNLEVLNLTYNYLKQIDSQTFIVKSLKKIFLFGNRWSCNCDNIKSMLEVLDNQTSVIDSKILQCNNSQKTIVEYNKKFCGDPKIDIKHFYSVIIALVLIVAILITIILVYIYRLEIQILCFVRFGWRLVFKKNRLDEEDKTYDAFVSYHSSQDDFVVYEMLPHLEGIKPAYKLCVHFRDFPVGAAIVDNITESIGNSKRTILLLNDQFLGSEWCKYEFQAAHFEALSNKLNTLIVVLLEDVNPDSLYGGLKLYMKTRTYLRYDDPRFWDKLRFALPEIKEENPVNQESSL